MANTPLPVKVWEVTISFNSARRLDEWFVGVGRANPLGEQHMIADDDHRTANTTPIWPFVLALVFAFVFVGSVLGVFLVGYFSVEAPPPDPVPATSQPAWQNQLQPGDTLIEIEEITSPPSGSDNAILSVDGEQIESILERQNSTEPFRPGDVILKVNDAGSPSIVTDDLDISTDGLPDAEFEQER